MKNIAILALALGALSISGATAEAQTFGVRPTAALEAYSAIPDVSGIWRVDRSDQIMMRIDQAGGVILSEFMTSDGYQHSLSGVWSSEFGRFDYTIRRKNLHTGAVTEVFGHLTVSGLSSFQSEAVGSDGRGDLPVNFHEVATWRRA